MVDIVLSYDTLFEILRIERSKTELQELPHDFNESVKKLLDDENSMLDTLDEAEKAKKEISIANMQKIIKELYDRRERKVVYQALDKSKAKSAIIDFSKFLISERKMFDEILVILDRHRTSVEEGMVSSEHKAAEPKVEKKLKEGPSNDEESREEPKEETLPSVNKEEASFKLVRFLSPVPSFLGLNMETYGPFDSEEVARLPSRIAELLVKKERAEEIKVES